MDFHFPLVYVNCVLFDIVMAIAYAMPVVGRTGVSVFSPASETYPAGPDSTAGKQKLTNFQYADRKVLVP